MAPFGIMNLQCMFNWEGSGSNLIVQPPKETKIDMNPAEATVCSELDFLSLKHPFAGRNDDTALLPALSAPRPIAA
jgi:hypothetical protein